MAKARALVKRLKAIKNIRKITRTMELIATARFKKAMDRATEASAYTRKMSEIVADLAQADLQFSHPLLESRPDPAADKTVVLILTSNRGLCGGYNSGVLRQAQSCVREIRAASPSGTTPRLQVVGKRGINFLKFQKFDLESTYTEFGDNPKFEDIDALANRYIEAYANKTLDRLDVAYTKFLTSARQVAVVETLLPLGQLSSDQSGHAPKKRIDYEFLPSAGEILKEIVPAAFKARLFKAFLDAAVSEQISRMVAMKAATENAGEIIRNITRQYNRARQAQITGELAEIIGGAAALE